jgi:hypothetical protein
MKTIEQLIQLSNNPYYKFSPEEKSRLNDFLSKKSEQSSQHKNNGKDSEKNIPATVLNKNVPKKETGEIPTINNVAKANEKKGAFYPTSLDMVPEAPKDDSETRSKPF